MKERVFVVEDDGLLREAVTLILTHAGYDVATTAVGRGAKDLVARFRPHLVLLDIRLPDISGLTVLGGLRAAGHTIPIVMMTADHRPDTVRDVMAMGGSGYLLKPFEPQDLIARVRLALKSARRVTHHLDD
ncbi:MAG: response regulator transcription factor [Brevundimonas sp.]|uniref:response regulator transcription factor n=1 Tax=Brevundimonas sp. TaxID=1871086 RepID=UPI003919E0F5